MEIGQNSNLQDDPHELLWYISILYVTIDSQLIRHLSKTLIFLKNMGAGTTAFLNVLNLSILRLFLVDLYI